MKFRSIFWQLVPLFPVATTALFCYLWLAQVVPANDRAEWITAVATVAALVTAGVAAAAALGQLRLLRIDAEERAQDERKAQARRVYLITDVPTLLEVAGETKIVLYNNSTEPVDRIQLHFRTPGEALDLFIGTLTPTGRSGESRAAIVEEIEIKIRAWQGKPVDMGSLPASAGRMFWDRDCYEIRMTFRNSAGRWWLRMEGYDLQEITSDVDAHITKTPRGISTIASILTTQGFKGSLRTRHFRHFCNPKSVLLVRLAGVCSFLGRKHCFETQQERRTVLTRCSGRVKSMKGKCWGLHDAGEL